MARRRPRDDASVVAALPEALDRLAADLRGGGSVVAALSRAAPSGGALRADFEGIVERAATVGVAEAIAWWRVERPDSAVAAVAGALEVAASVGGRSAASLEGLATGLRDRRETAQEVVALSAQARLSALVVALAPLGSLGFSLMADGRVLAALLGTTAGWACLGAGLGLEALAWAWMRGIVRGQP